MGFFANIPKPPKLAGFFGDEEEENASDGTNMTEGEGEGRKNDDGRNRRRDGRFGVGKRARA